MTAIAGCSEAQSLSLRSIVNGKDATSAAKRNDAVEHEIQAKDNGFMPCHYFYPQFPLDEREVPSNAPINPRPTNSTFEKKMDSHSLEFPKLSLFSSHSERPRTRSAESVGLLSPFSETITSAKRSFLSWSNRPIDTAPDAIEKPIEPPDLEKMRSRRHKRVVAFGVASGVGCTLAMGPIVGVAVGLGAGVGAASVGEKVGKFHEKKELINYRRTVWEQLRRRRQQRSVEQLNSQIYNLPPSPYEPYDES